MTVVPQPYELWMTDHAPDPGDPPAVGRVVAWWVADDPGSDAMATPICAWEVDRQVFARGLPSGGQESWRFFNTRGAAISACAPPAEPPSRLGMVVEQFRDHAEGFTVRDAAALRGWRGITRDRAWQILTGGVESGVLRQAPMTTPTGKTSKVHTRFFVVAGSADTSTEGRS